MSVGAPLRLAVGALSVRSGSALDARRLADQLPAALERALAARNAGTPLPPARSAAEQAATQIAAAVSARLERGP